mmetsp:Transcript_5139/g.7849  ORF Transcript_5139/g.7849 Transcript_5139/m.7849 type:complete len:206 (-) Transcript_5139:603-1220(-)
MHLWPLLLLTARSPLLFIVRRRRLALPFLLFLQHFVIFLLTGYCFDLVVVIIYPCDGRHSLEAGNEKSIRAIFLIRCPTHQGRDLFEFRHTFQTTMRPIWNSPDTFEFILLGQDTHHHILILFSIHGTGGISDNLQIGKRHGVQNNFQLGLCKLRHFFGGVVDTHVSAIILACHGRPILGRCRQTRSTTRRINQNMSDIPELARF